MGDVKPSRERRLRRVVTPIRSLGAGLGGLVAGLGVWIVGAAIAAEPELGLSARVAAAVVGFALGAAFAWTGYRLIIARGGITIDEGEGRLGIGLTSRQDVWWVALSEVRGVRLYPIDLRFAGGNERLWIAGIELEGRPPIVFAETPEYDEAAFVARQLSLVTGLEEQEAAPQTLVAEPRAERVELRMRRGAALQDVYGLFGLSLMLIGAGLLSQLQASVVVGVFVAPVMLLLGAVFFGMVIAKRYGREELQHSEGRWIHRYRLGGLSWGERTVLASTPRWQLRVHSLRGAALEVVADDGILVLGTGATTRSDAGIDELSQLPQRFASSDPKSD